MNFSLKNTNRFPLKGTNGRFLHLATIHYGAREFMCFADTTSGLIYTEEITGGIGPLRIEDDSLALALERFLKGKGVLDVARPTIPDIDWLRAGKAR